MRTFQYRLHPNQQQRRQMMRCLMASRSLYNEMLEATKAAYAQTGKFLFKYDLTTQFKGRGGDTVPATTVQVLADRLDKALRRYLAFKEQGIPCGFRVSSPPIAGTRSNCANMPRTGMPGWRVMGSIYMYLPNWACC